MGTWLSGLEFKSPARHDPNACNLSANRTETNRSWEFTGWVSFTFSERPYLRNRQRMKEQDKIPCFPLVFARMSSGGHR